MKPSTTRFGGDFRAVSPLRRVAPPRHCAAASPRPVIAALCAAPSLRGGIAALVIAAAAALPAAAATPGAVTPYTFIGRVVDATHAGFDTNRVCTLAAYNDESGELLAQTRTFFYPDSRRNYALRVPVSTDKAAGYAVQGEALAIAATDDLGKVWEGVIPGALCGEAAGIREVDIVLGEDKDGNGIDDALYADLRAQWEASDYWEYGAEFDPNRDYDGDGVSTIAEAYAGTDPFATEDGLRITAFSPAAGGTRDAAAGTFSLAFPTVPSRAYSVETASDLANPEWTAASFSVDPTQGTAVNVIARPSTGGPKTFTVYLLPMTNSAAFFRVKAE